MIALALVGWRWYVRVIRSEILTLRDQDFVQAAKIMGVSDIKIIMRHIIPNAIYPVLILATMDMGSMVITASFMSFVGLGAPYWDPYARGTLVGLTRGTTRAHLVRATLEGICFQSRDLVESMMRDAAIDMGVLRVDGGAVVNDVLMQMQADILGVPVQRPAVTETTALGAALLAGLATDVWQSQDDIARRWQVEREFAPQMSADQRESLYAGWLRAVERAKGWIEA